MKNKQLRLVISGFPCGAKPWEKLFEGMGPTQILTLHEVLAASGSTNIREISKYVGELIKELKPSSLVVHDYGALFGLMALLRLKRRDELNPHLKLILFNGAFRGFNVFKATHPFKIQFLNWKLFSKLATKSGAKVDTKLKAYWPQIKKLYLQVIAGSLLGLLKDIVIKSEPKFNMGIDIQLIRSDNDPFILSAALDCLQKDFGIKKVHHTFYGHFPYNGEILKIRKLVERFEASGSY